MSPKRQEAKDLLVALLGSIEPDIYSDPLFVGNAHRLADLLVDAAREEIEAEASAPRNDCPNCGHPTDVDGELCNDCRMVAKGWTEGAIGRDEALAAHRRAVGRTLVHRTF